MSNFDEVKQYIDQKDNTHILGLCETYLTGDITDDMINIDGFSLQRKDRHKTRDKLGGGLAVYISNSLNYKRRKDLGSNHLESVWCQ